MRTLEEVLKELKDAEKEYSDKCLKYGISEKSKRKKENSNEDNKSEDLTQNSQEEIKENVDSLAENEINL